MKDIYSEVVELEGNYKSGSIDIVDGLKFNQYNLIKTIEFYTNSEYLNGGQDELGREKPFHNIVNANVDIAVVATDLDTKDIQLSSKDKGMRGFVKSFLLTKEVELWMKEENYAKTLNVMGEARARYGGVLVKRVMDGDKLKLEVVQWKNVTCDAADILNSPIIETHYFTISQLLEKRDVWENIDEAIKLLKKGERKLRMCEVHGMFPKSYIEGDSEKYERQVHIIAYNGTKWSALFSDYEKESPYKYLPWKAVSGRALGRGVVEEGIEAQVWTNDSVMAERDIMALAGKLVLQTASSKYKGKNILNEIVTGTILETEPDRPISQVDLSPRTIPVFEGLVERWQRQFDRSTAVTDALRGETPPSGQAFRLAALVTQQSASSFDYRREEMGIFQKEIFYDWILPYLSKRLKKKHTLDGEFDVEQLQFIDHAYVMHLTMKELEKANKDGRGIDPMQLQSEVQNALEKLTKTKAHRFLGVPDDYLDGKYQVDITTTGEQMNKTAAMESMKGIFEMIMSTYNPQTGQFAAMQDPVLREILGRLTEVQGLGLSPVDLFSKPQMPLQMQPRGGQPTAPSDSTLPDPASVGAGRDSANA